MRKDLRKYCQETTQDKPGIIQNLEESGGTTRKACQDFSGIETIQRMA